MARDERQDKRLRAQLDAAIAIGDRAATTILRARLAADHPEYVGSDEAQEALAEAAELAKIARRKARTLAPGELVELYGR